MRPASTFLVIQLSNSRMALRIIVNLFLAIIINMAAAFLVSSGFLLINDSKTGAEAAHFSLVYNYHWQR